MHLCLFEDARVQHLRPLTETRPVYDLRLGIRTLLDTTADAFPAQNLLLHSRPLVAPITAQTYDDEAAHVNALPHETDVLFVNGRFVATNGPAVEQIREHVQANAKARTFTHDGTLVAAWVPRASARLPDNVLSTSSLSPAPFADLPTTSLDEATLITQPWDLLTLLRPALRRDAAARSTPSTAPLSARPQASVHESVIGVHPDRISLGRGVTVCPGAILNAEAGPIVIDDEATISEQAVIKGPCYVGPKTQIKVGASIEGAAFGYYCKVGGEVHDTIIHSLSNKAHPGFLGHSYLGRWCNLGADTNISNLKNNYGEISAYAPAEDAFVPTGRRFAGLLMGDHSKCAINTMFNTGTVVGTYCNLYGGDFPPQYLPPFSWGGPHAGFSTYRLSKALEVAEHVMSRRDRSLTDADRTLLSTLFEETAAERDAHH